MATKRKIHEIITDIRTADDTVQIARERSTLPVYQMAKLAVELADAMDEFAKVLRSDIEALEVGPDGMIDEERSAPLWRGVLGDCVPQFVAVIRDRRGDSITDENTVAEAVSFVFNLDMIEVRANLTNLGGSGVRWGIPLSVTGHDAYESGTRIMRDQFSGYSIHFG